MKALLPKILKYFLIGLVALLVVLMIVGIVLVAGWPWWVSIFILLFMAGLGIGGYLAYRAWQKRNAAMFVDEVIEKDQARVDRMSARELEDHKVLQERWKTVIEKIRKSHLKKMGNPLYVLPWYMIIGESGSGKTTSLNSARLSTFTDSESSGSISGTKDCDWWFLDDSIIIDTAGRYAIPVNGDPDKNEWQKVMSLLLKYRKKEPLNGVIVTVAADKLLGSPVEQIEEEGKTIRRRIDELMRVLGLKLPVYLLVTKCDLIQGMNNFSAKFSDDTLKQPMGIINQDLSTDITAFLDNAMSTIGKRLRNMRLLLLHQSDSKATDRAMLLFPEEFEGIKGPLQDFLKTLFGKNPYQETPLLRGLYFSSGRQKGQPISQFHNSLDTVDENGLPDTARGLFLHDFFSKILPKDRDILMPTKRAAEWNLLAGNLGLISWVIVCIALCGLLSFSFVKNMRTISGISNVVHSLPVMTGDFATDMVSLEQFRAGINRVEDQNRKWWIPRFFLTESLHVERVLKEQYCKKFRTGFMQPFDAKMTDSLRVLSSSCSDEQYAQYMDHLVRRINLLNTALDNPKPENLKKRYQPSYVFLGGANANAESGKGFGLLYFYYLAWRADKDDMKKEVFTLQDWLKKVYALRTSNMNWILLLVDRQGTVSAATLAEFWGGTQPVSGEKFVQPSFTSKGKNAVDYFLKELEEAYPEAAALSKNKGAFDERYRVLCFEAWKSFADGFSAGAGRLKDAKEMQDAAVKMAADGGAYFALINRISTELEPLVADNSMPAWLSQIYQFQALKAQGLAQQSGVVGKAAETGKNLLTTVEKKLGADAGGKNLEQQMIAGQAFAAYKSSLASIAPSIASRNQAYQLTVQTFSEDAATGKSPFYTGYNAIERMKPGLGDGSPDATVKALISGPLDFLWGFMRKETSAYLEAQWNETVLAPVMGMNPQQAMPMLAGQDGLLWKFVKGPAAPFLSRDARSGYSGKHVLSSSIPLERGFYSFLNTAAKGQIIAATRQSNYNVGIRGLPTEANPEAKFQPHGTRLELQCGANAQTLVNNNYPVSKTFYWMPDGCSEVALQIEISDLVLTKRYSGPQAFPDFLKDFRGGSRKFSAREFPGEKSALDRAGVNWIRVEYEFVGSGPVIQAFNTSPGQLPMSIGAR